MTTRKSRLNNASSSLSTTTTTTQNDAPGKTKMVPKSPTKTTPTKTTTTSAAKQTTRSPLSQVLSPNNAVVSSNNISNSSFSESSPNDGNTPTRRHLTTAELTKPSLKVYVEQMTTPPPSSSSMIANNNNNNNNNNKSVEEIAEELLKQSNENQTKMVLMDLLQTAKENANYKLMLERMKSDEVENSLKSSRKMSEVTQVYETLREDKMKAEMEIAKLQEEKKSLMMAAEKAKASATVETDFVAKTPSTAPTKQFSSASLRFATTSTVNDGNNNVGIFASPRWEAVKKSATETAERLRALSSEKGTAASPFTGGKARTIGRPKRAAVDNNDDDEEEEEDIFVDALNTVAQTQQLHRSKRMTETTTAKPSVRAIEKTQNSIADALRDSNNELEVKNLLASLDEYVLSLRERISSSSSSTTTTTTNSGEEASTSAPTREEKLHPTEMNKEEEVLKIADKADNSIKSLFQLLFIKESGKKKVNTTVDRVKSDLLKTFEEEDDGAQNRLLKKEQDERKKDNEKAAETFNKVQLLLDEKTNEAKRMAESLEDEKRKNKALQTKLAEKMKEMEEEKERKSVASVSVQTQEVEDVNSNSKLNEYESLVALLKEENQGKDVQMLQLQQEFADSMSTKNAELSKLEKEVREQDEKISELSHACAHFAEALESAEEEVETLKEEAKRGGEMEMKMESLKEMLTERTHELNIAQSEKTNLEQKCEELQSEMLFKVAALENLKQSHDELEANEVEVENVYGLLAEEVENFERLYEEEKERKKGLIAKYSTEKEEMLQIINHLGNDMKMYEREAFTWWTRAELENTHVADLEDEIERLQDELERANEEQDERTELLLDIAKLKEEKRAVEEALEKVDTTNKTLNVRLKKSYERIQELDEEIESANSDCDFLRKEVDEANSRVQVLEAWCKETKIHGEINDEDNNTSSESYDYAKIPARYEELKLENLELMEKLTASKAVEESLSQRLENIMHETDGLKDEAKTAFMKSSEMQKMTENAVEKTAQMTSELEEATNEIQKLENLLAVSRQQVQTLEKQLASRREEIRQDEDGNAVAKEEILHVDRNDEDAGAIKEYFEAQNEELTALLASKTNELTQMQAEIENLKRKSSSEEDAKTLRGENYELAVRHKATLERLTATMEEKEALEKSCQHYETTIEKMQVVVKELKTEVEKLKSLAPNKTSQSTQTIEDGCPSSSEAATAAVREKIVYVHDPRQHLPPPARKATSTEEDEMFYDVADDFHHQDHHHQIRDARRVSVYPLAPRGQLPPLRRNAIESYHYNAQRMRLRKECELEERELFRMKQEKRILSARMKEEKRSSLSVKESEKKSIKVKKSSKNKSSSTAKTTSAAEFPAQSLSFKTPQVSTKEEKKIDDEASPSPSSDIVDGCKAPENTPADEPGIIHNNTDDENASVLLETALTAKLVLENSRKADEKAKHYKKQARAAFKSLENINEEMQRMKRAFVKEENGASSSMITPLTESKFLMRRP